MKKVWVILLIMAMIVGCGNGNGGEKAKEVILEDKTLGVSGGNIGKLEADNLLVAVPENALEGEQKLSLGEVKDFEKIESDRGTLLSDPIDVSVDQSLSRFNEPILIKFALTETEVQSKEALDELWVAYFNGENWEFIRPTEINLTEKYMAFETYHFSWFSKAKPTKAEIASKFAKDKSVEIWQNRNNNNVLRDQTSKIVKDILSNQLGVNSKSIEQDVVEAILKENDYAKLLANYNEGKMDEFGTDLAVLAGQKIFETIKDLPESDASLLLGNITEHASKVGTGVQMATFLYNGQYEDAAKALSNEIMDAYPLTKMLKVSAEITDRQIKRWKDQELEAAYQVFINGAESNVPFWGYNVEKGNFDELWDQMRGLQTKVLDDAIKDYAVQNGMPYESIGNAMMEKIRKQAKEQLRGEFENRQKNEAEIAKIELENKKLLDAFEKAHLFEKYLYGYDDNSTFEFRLERLFRIKDMILRDTGARITNLDLPDLGEISHFTIARLASAWYTPDDGKAKYKALLIQLGYWDAYPTIDEVTGVYPGTMTFTKVDVPTADQYSVVSHNEEDAEGCDAFGIDANVIFAALKEREGTSMPYYIIIEKESDTSGFLSLSEDGMMLDQSDVPEGIDPRIHFTYEDGIIKGYQDNQGIHIAVNLTPTKVDSGMSLKGQLDMKGMEDLINIVVDFKGMK